jgi:hypothetical protein
MDRPETRFAWNDDVALAFQVIGDGQMDLLYRQGYASHVDLSWGSPYLSRSASPGTDAASSRTAAAGGARIGSRHRT